MTLTILFIWMLGFIGTIAYFLSDDAEMTKLMEHTDVAGATIGIIIVSMFWFIMLPIDFLDRVWRKFHGQR